MTPAMTDDPDITDDPDMTDDEPGITDDPLIPDDPYEFCIQKTKKNKYFITYKQSLGGLY